MRFAAIKLNMGRAGFTLVELLAVVAIIAVLLVVALPALKSIQGTALSTSARQVSNSMQLARQYAISRRNTARFLVAVHTSSGAIPAGLVCRAYTVCIATNDSSGNLVGWLPLQDWQILPEGIVFNNVDITTYSPATINEIPVLGNSGERILQGGFASANAWKYFDSTNSMTVFIGGSSTNWIASLVEFQPMGLATGPDGKPLAGSTLGGVRLAQGSVLDPSNRTLLITDTNNWVYVEFDQYSGRARVRYRNDYK